MNVGQMLKSGSQILFNQGISTDRLDIVILLEDATGKDRGWLLAHPEFELTTSMQKKLNIWIKRRARHEPLAYIRDKSEFYGREFKVTKDTLEPRPETETMIDLLKTLPLSSRTDPEQQGQSHQSAQGPSLSIVDVGTGSGCLAITAKLEFPDADVMATDISPACIKIAHQNAKTFGADVTFYQGNLLQPLFRLLKSSSSGQSHMHAEPVLFLRNEKSRTSSTMNEYHKEKTGSAAQGFGRILSSAQQQDKTTVTVLLCNLPYVPDSHTINQAAMFEPKLAIFGGPDGLDIYQDLFAQIKKLANKPQHILTESLPTQHNALKKIAKSAGYSLRATDDFIQWFRLD